MLIPHIILSGSRTNSNLLMPFCDFNINWATIEHGYVYLEFVKEYASRLRQQFGHDWSLLELLDGHATRDCCDVIEHCLNLNIKLFFIPPHTSHGLAAWDQFNNHIQFTNAAVTGKRIVPIQSIFSLLLSLFALKHLSPR